MTMPSPDGQRFRPQLPPSVMRTFGVRAPLATHHRKATCFEVDCEAYLNGWTTTVDTSTVLGAQQANYIRLKSGRSFTASEVGDLVTFSFPAGQTCFRQHQVMLEREPIFLRRQGDWRTRDLPVIMRGEDWLDDFATNQQGLQEGIDHG